MTLESRWSNSPYRVGSVQRILCVGTIFPSLISGKKSIDRVTSKNVIAEITIVGIIKSNRYYLPFHLDSKSK